MVGRSSALAVMAALISLSTASGVLQGSSQHFCYPGYPNSRKQFGFSVSLTNSAPWDNTVTIYTGTVQNPNTNMSSVTWAQAQVLQQTDNLYSGSNGFPNVGHLYFGWSVSLTSDGAFLAVGSPGRGTTAEPIPNNDSTNPPVLDDFNYEGSFFLYQLVDGSYNQVQEFNLNNPHRFYDKFGHRVKFSANGQWLFVTANAGWSGAPLNNLYPVTSSEWPFGPLVDVVNQGVYVYQYSSTSSPPYSFVQFLQSSCLEPLGLKGIDLDIGNNDQTLLIRDCNPANNGMKSAVSQYSLSNGVWNFVRYIDNPVQVTKSDVAWFGYGIALGPNNTAAFGEPGFAQQVVIQQLDPNTQNLNNVGTVNNVFGRNIRSYYGGNVKFVAQDRLLLVSDAIKSNGQGIIYVYHLSSPTEYVAGFETSVTTSTSPYYLVGSFIKSLDSAANLTSGNYVTDQFGAAVAVSDDTIVVGAPVEGCVYVFPVPQLIEVPLAVVVVPPNINPNVTVAPTVPVQNVVSNGANIALIAGIICGIVAAILIATAVFFALREYQKRVIRKRILSKFAQLQQNE